MTYTREQIMQMDTEQLRVAIAEAKGIDIQYPFSGKYGPFYQDGLTGMGTPYLSKLPNWPTSIADAWELYREMKQAGCIVVVTHAPDGRGYCHVNTLQQGDKLIGVYSSDELHAICEAYLIWLNEDQHESD